VPPEQAFQLLEEMKQGGLQPNTITHAGTINACGFDPRAGIDALGRSSAHAPVPDVIAYSAAIGACRKTELSVWALRSFAEM
jgi:hypothetical protein